MPKPISHSITLLNPNPHLLQQLTLNLRIHKKQLVSVSSPQQSHLPSLHKYTINQTMFVHEWNPANLTKTVKNQQSGYVLQQQSKRWKDKAKDEMNFVGIGKNRKKNNSQKQQKQRSQDNKIHLSNKQKHKSLGKQGLKAAVEDIVLVQIQKVLNKEVREPNVNNETQSKSEIPFDQFKSALLSKQQSQTPVSVTTQIRTPLSMPPVKFQSDDELTKTKSRIQKLISQYNSNKRIHEEIMRSQKNMLVSSLSKDPEMTVNGQAKKEQIKPSEDKKRTVRSKSKISYLPIRMKLKSNWKRKQFPFTTISHPQMIAVLQQLFYLPFPPPPGPKHPKFFIGDGNNQTIIGRLMKQRGWKPVSEISQADFIWTQTPLENVMDQIIPSQNVTIKINNEFNKKKSLISVQNEDSISICSHNQINSQKFLEKQNLNNIQINKHSILKQIDQFMKQKKNPFLELCSKLFPPQTFLLYMFELLSKFKSDLSLASMNNLSSYLSTHPPLNYSFKIPIPSSFPLFVNHRINCNQIGDKKRLWLHLKNYCKIMQIDEADLVVRTTHVGEDEKLKLQGLSEEKLKDEIEKILQQFKEQECFLLKPGEQTNRGNGITVHLSKSTVISSIISYFSTANAHTLLIQKYLPPLLYHSRKFDIRMWCLLTSTQMWMFKEGYCRTSSQEFSMESRQRMVHLTNDAVQKFGEAYGKHQKANKVSFSELDKYMHGLFYQKIYPQIKQLTSILWQIAMPLTNGTPSQFQLLGLDFLIDQNGKVWLIECNTNPCLQTPCSLLTRLVNNMLADLLQIVIGPWTEGVQGESMNKFGWQIVSDQQGKYWKKLAQERHQDYWNQLQIYNKGKMKREK